MVDPHVHVVLMAGGAGARFWPVSRRATPKQLLPLGRGEVPLVAATIARTAAIAAPSNVWVVTAAHLVEATRAALPEVPAEGFLAEPVGRNTAPCIGWAAVHALARDPEAVLAVLPADHEITDPEAFEAAVATALATARAGHLVTIGIRPNRPETGYGYMEVGESLATGAHLVRRFVEKPDEAAAARYVAGGGHLWNSGMFFFEARRFVDAVREHLPDLGAALDEIAQAIADGREAEAIARIFPALRSVSVDYGIMEHASRVAVVPADLGWSDLGSWHTAWELAHRDAGGNAAPREAVLVDTRGSYVRAAPGKVVALVGVEDLVVVDTPDALLVVPRARAQEVRKVVDELRRRGRTDLL